ncbi:MAG: GNAT family protein [Chitinophagaceae bacterium]
MLNLDFSIFPNLETERLVLRQLKEEDTKELFFLRTDENVLQLIGKEPAKDIKEVGELLNKINESIKHAETIMWGIALKSAPAKIIGTICFWNIARQHYRAEIGYLLHPDHWRKGLMKEAILQVLDYGFNDMKLHSVEGRIKADNRPSAGILEATGFVQEGYLKEEYYFKDKFYDSIIYSRLR